MRKADTPSHKRHLIRMYYCGDKLPLGIRLWNQKKIDWTMENVIIPQCYAYNEGEEQIKRILKKHNYNFKTQHPIVIADEDKTIRRIFLVDFLIDNKVIVEVDGCYHDKQFDEERDKLTSSLGLKTLRIPRTDNCYNEDQIVEQINALLEV